MIEAAAFTVTLDGRGNTARPDIPPRPDWWSLASCLGDGPDEWVVRRGDAPQLRTLRAKCAACPAAGACLEDAMTLDNQTRELGPLRVGTTGKSWLAVERLVEELQPSTDAEWTVLASWIVDGDVRTRKKQTAAA